MEEDLLTDLYIRLKSLDLLLESLEYKLLEEWDYSKNSNNREVGENIYAMLYVIRLVVKQLWRIRKIYYWLMCKEKYGQWWIFFHDIMISKEEIINGR